MKKPSLPEVPSSTENPGFDHYHHMIRWLRQFFEAGTIHIVPKDFGDFIDENGKWQCIEDCGACCTDMGWAYDELADKTGQCCFLADDKSCSVYEDRPYLCRSDVVELNPDNTAPWILAKVCALQRRWMRERTWPPEDAS